MSKKIPLFVLMLAVVFSPLYATEKAAEALTPQLKYEIPAGTTGNIQGMWTWQDGFEGAFPGSWHVGANTSRFGWDKTDNNPHQGKSSVWCSSEAQYHGNDSQLKCGKCVLSPNVWMWNGPHKMEPYMKWAKWEFYMHLQMACQQETLRVEYFVEDHAGHWLCDFKDYLGKTDGYVKVTYDLAKICCVDDIKLTSIQFRYINGKSSNNVQTVWIDDVRLRRHFYDPTEANFEGTPLAGKVPLEVQFTNRSGGTPNMFIWDYGDGFSEYLREARPNWTNPYHIYKKAGEFDVTLVAWVNEVKDSLTIPNMVYVDSVLDYCALEVVSSGETWPGEGWDNLCDHDLYGGNSILAAVATDAWGILKMADDAAKAIAKLRILTDTIKENVIVTNWAKDVRFTFSLDDVFDSNDTAVEVTCVQKDGEWDEFDLEAMLTEPVVAKYIQVEILSSRGENARYRELAELQVLYNPDPVMAKQAPAQAISATDLPTQFDLAQNYPNPFNPETSIHFQLPEPANVELAIYNIQGQRIRTLVNGQLEAGYHKYVWNATDFSGASVAAGVYIYKLRTIDPGETRHFVKKMILMK